MNKKLKILLEAIEDKKKLSNIRKVIEIDIALKESTQMALEKYKLIKQLSTFGDYVKLSREKISVSLEDVAASLEIENHIYIDIENSVSNISAFPEEIAIGIFRKLNLDSTISYSLIRKENDTQRSANLMRGGQSDSSVQPNRKETLEKADIFINNIDQVLYAWEISD